MGGAAAGLILRCRCVGPPVIRGMPWTTFRLTGLPAFRLAVIGSVPAVRAMRAVRAGQPVGGHQFDGRFVGFIHQPFGEFDHRAAMHARQIGVRVERGPWHQHEGPLPCTRMGQGKRRIVRFDAVVVDDVQVECAVGPMRFACAAMIVFDALQTFEKIVRTQSGRHLHHGVQEVRRAVSHAPRGGTVQRRHPGDLRAGKRVDAADGVAQRARHIALVAAECDDGMMGSTTSNVTFRIRGVVRLVLRLA